MRIASYRGFFAVSTFAATVFLCAQVCTGFAQGPNVSSAARKPVLVELFTSEGCSSCPPADALLARLGSQQPVAGAETIILEEHVDYWDDQGWRDPFAYAAATKRQNEYAFILGGEVYTPEMIVDGRAAFVGSETAEARREIQSAAGFPKAEIRLEWSAQTRGDSRLLKVHIGRLPDSAINTKPELFLAVTENGLHSSVLRGENAGRALVHDGVVRTFTRAGAANPRSDAAFDGEIPISGTGAGWKRENLRVVVFVQDPKTRRVFAVDAIPYTTSQ